MKNLKKLVVITSVLGVVGVGTLVYASDTNEGISEPSTIQRYCDIVRDKVFNKEYKAMYQEGNRARIGMCRNFNINR